MWRELRKIGPRKLKTDASDTYDKMLPTPSVFRLRERERERERVKGKYIYYSNQQEHVSPRIYVRFLCKCIQHLIHKLMWAGVVPTQYIGVVFVSAVSCVHRRKCLAAQHVAAYCNK